MPSWFWWCLLHAYMRNRECSIFRTFSIEAVTMLRVSKNAHISNSNFIFYSGMKKFLKFAHAKFLTLKFLNNAWAKINFDTKFELSVKLRVEWYIMIRGSYANYQCFQKTPIFTPTQFSKILKTWIIRSWPPYHNISFDAQFYAEFEFHYWERGT